MATLQKSWPFTSDAEGFSATGGTADTTLGWSSTGGNTGGCISSRIFGRNKSADPAWDWNGTWADLGVPTGATVTHAQIWCDWRCSEWNVGNNQTQFRYAAILDLAASVISQADGSTVSGTTSYATISGSQGAVAAGNGDPTDAVNISVDVYLRSGNNASAAVTLLFDNVLVEVTYTEAGQTHTKSVLIATGAIPRVSRKPSVVLSVAASAVASASRVGSFFRTLRMTTSVVASAVAQRVAQQYQRAVSAVASVVPSVSRVGSFYRTARATVSAVAGMGYDWSGQVYPSLRLKVFTTKRAASSVLATAIAYKESALRHVSVAVSALVETRAYRLTSRTFHAAALPLARVTRRASRLVRVAAEALPRLTRHTTRAFTAAASVVASASARTLVAVIVRAVASVSTSVSRSTFRTFRAASSVVASVSRFTSRTLRAVASAAPRAMKASALAVRAVAGAVASVVPLIIQQGKVIVRATASASVSVSRRTGRTLRAVATVGARVAKHLAVSVRVAASAVARAVALVGRFVTVRVTASVVPSVSRMTTRYAKAAAIVRVGVSRRVSRVVRVLVEVTPTARRLTALTRSVVASVKARMFTGASLIPKSIKHVAGRIEETMRLVGNRARVLLEGDEDRHDIDGEA